MWPHKNAKEGFDDLIQRSSDCRICIQYKRTCTIDYVEDIRNFRKNSSQHSRANTMGWKHVMTICFRYLSVLRSNWVCVRHSMICTKRFLLCKPKTSTSCITTVGKEWLRATAIVHPPCVCYQSSSYGKPKASW